MVDVGNSAAAATAGPTRWVAGGALVLALLALVADAFEPQEGAAGVRRGPAPVSRAAGGCTDCHEGIEAMHPGADLACVDCHGGDATARKKLAAHVQPKSRDPGDERVVKLDDDLTYRRFVNPMDLRIVDRTCGECHGGLVHDLRTSLHGTTAGHLSDGYYEMGLLEKRGSVYSVFPVPRRLAEGGEVERLVQVPPFRHSGPMDRLSTHYTDLARKECMQCHLWSEGRAVRGRTGQDGDYRGQGCAACHVRYALDGLTDTADRAAVRNEPGHPWRHAMTRAPGTETCTSCHYGDASIGLHFRGLSQLPPGAPGGPDIPGTTDSLLNRVFYLDDNEICPPDVHHERGMSCIDCHTLGDVMGDGQLHGQMEHAVEISCQACHGTFTARSTLKTERGTPLEHLFLDEVGDVFLRSKVSGEVHRVKQVVDVLDPGHIDYNEDAERAMTGEHGQVECYTCHAGWNANFLGFHFQRNEALSQLDLLSGMRTPGRVTTQEKVFATWKSFYAGLNEAGRVAPYLTGFSTMGSVDDKDGKRVLDQVMPVTAAGLSGMTMVHHQLHSVRPTARSCVECHRTSTTWGMGSANFRLARQLAFVADRRGIEVVALNRTNLSASIPLAKIVLPDVVDLVIDCDPLQGHARYLYAAEGGRGIHVIDVRDPTTPRRVAFIESIGPRGLELAGDYLYSADGIGGLRIYDVSEPEQIRLVGLVPMFDAHAVTLQWPYAYVADGPGGLAIVDVRAPIAPRFLAGIDMQRARGSVAMAIDVAVLFQYSRPRAGPDGAPLDSRSSARNLCAVVDELEGLMLFDVTEPKHPEVLWPRPDRRTVARRRNSPEYRGLALLSHVDVASPQGGARTVERDYVYLLEELSAGNGRRRSFVRSIDVTNPERIRLVGRTAAGFSTEMLAPIAVYNPPFLQQILLTPGELGVYATDASISEELNQLGVFSALRNTYVVAVEEFPLDRMIDAGGRRLKDVSHPTSRWLYRAEIERLLDVSAEALGTLDDSSAALPESPGVTARKFFAQYDEDRSGLLTGSEYAKAGGANIDRNGDGRVTLLETALMGGYFGGRDTAVAEGPPPVFLATRVDSEGDLARLLDGVNPYEFDRDDDDKLDRRELTAAFFEALDLDDDHRLSFAELSRHPGNLRQLRYGDHSALARFDRKDLNDGGSISLREFVVEDRDWRALDIDASGHVQLRVEPTPWEREWGFVGAMTEWPTRQPNRTGLPPVITAERVLAAFDSDHNERLSQRELRKRPDLFREMERNGDGFVDLREIQYRVRLAAEQGVDVTADGFVERWDLDGNGRVEDDELPEGAELVLARERQARR